MVQMVVDHGSKQVVRRGDRVEVAGQVKVHGLHRHDLAVACARRAALDAERRPEGWLPQREHRPVPEQRQALGEPDRGGGLALTQWRGRHGSDDDVLRLRPVGHGGECRRSDLGDIPAVSLKVLGLNAGRGRDLFDGQQLGSVADV